MENIIKKLLREGLLGEALNGGSFTVYHGSPTKITTFVDEFVGSYEAIDQEGPGIYFTSSKDEAQGYGEFVYSVTLTPKQLYGTGPTNKKILAPLISKMIKKSEDWQDEAQNWDENPNLGIKKYIESILNKHDIEKDVIQSIWFDFYRYRSVEFVRNIVSMGIDGLIVPKEYNDVTHYIIYNPKIINLV